MLISSPCLTDIKNWLVQSKWLLLASPKQKTLGKDFSNALMADRLPKTIWLSMHHVVAMKHWLFQSKRLLARKILSDWDLHLSLYQKKMKKSHHLGDGICCTVIVNLS
ncbi:hypothetical protein Tco_1548079 [Tanacetum coccineum]